MTGVVTAATWSARPRSELGGLACITAGTSAGAPVILLHGVGLRAEAWGAQVAALSGYRVLAPDMPGHGESAPLDSTATLGAYTDRVVGLIETIAAPVVLAGHSMGAMIALDVASRYPALCIGVAAINAIFRRTEEAAASVRARAAALSTGAGADPSVTIARWFGDDLDSDAAIACRAWLTTAPPAGYRAAYGVFAAENGPSEDALRTIRCPALFLTGASDPNSTPAMAKAMAGRVPAGDAMVLPGAAHMMPMTHPAEVNAALLAFVDRCHRACP